MAEEHTMQMGNYGPVGEETSTESSDSNKPSKQRAMEYLMTYGLAVFAIIAVLGVMGYLGFFNGSPLGTTCSSLSGFYCSNPIYSVSTGNLTFTFGQNTGYSWSTVNITFVNQSEQSYAQSNGLVGINQVRIQGGLLSGQITNITIPVSGPVKKGSSKSGYMWVGYTVSGSNSVSYLQVATISLKAD